MTSTRKEFFKRIAYVGLATIPLIFFWEQEGPERFIAGAVFIFGLYQVIMIVTMSQQIIDDFFPPKTYKDARTKPFDNIVYRLAPGLFFAGLVFEIFEIRRMDNTIGGARLFWTYASLGIVIAVVVTILLKLKSPSIYFESRRRITVHFGLFLGFFLFVPASASFINHALSDSRIDCNKCKIISKSTGGRRNKSSWIFLKINGREERFDVARTFWNSVNERDLLSFVLKKDIWVMTL